MKELFKAVTPFLKQFSWKLGTIAKLGNRSWILVEENGGLAEVVFRKDGELLVVDGGVIRDARWELVEEMEAIILEVDGARRMYCSTWGGEPILFVEEYGTHRKCVFLDSQWIKSELIPGLLELLEKKPQLLANGYYLNFAHGYSDQLENGAELRTMHSDIHGKFNSMGSRTDNPVFVDGKIAADGLYWGSSSFVYEVKAGSLWTVFHYARSIGHLKYGRVRLFRDSQHSSWWPRKGDLLVGFKTDQRIQLPDGKYRLSRWSSVQIENGRVI